MSIRNPNWCDVVLAVCVGLMVVSLLVPPSTPTIESISLESSIARDLDMSANSETQIISWIVLEQYEAEEVWIISEDRTGFYLTGALRHRTEAGANDSAAKSKSREWTQWYCPWWVISINVEPPNIPVHPWSTRYDTLPAKSELQDFIDYSRLYYPFENLNYPG